MAWKTVGKGFAWRRYEEDEPDEDWLALQGRLPKRVVGHGGGKSGGSGGINDDPDTLRSIAYATVVDLIAAGEIMGLVNGAQSIYFNGTPLQNPDDSYNFSNVQWDFRTGTQAQAPFTSIPGANDVESEIEVGVEFRNDTPVVRTITDPDTDSCRVTVYFPSLQYTDSNGIHGTDVQYAIDVQSNGGGFVQVVFQDVNGKSSGQWEQSHVFDLPGSAPWDIRLRRITADNHSSVLQNQSYWSSYTQIQRALFNYPNCAVSAIRIDASQFQSLPTVGWVVNGWKVPIPTNYNTTTRAYTGIWDGTFQMAWTDNPAWCFYAVLQSSRDGLGQFLSPQALSLTKWDLYTIAQYCDELVPDGKGGAEPRFTCAVYMAGREDPYTALNNLASIFRGMIYWGAGSVAVTQDAPPPTSTPAALFTNANVIAGKFSYSGIDMDLRHTVALVTWVDPSNNFAKTVEYVPDYDGIAELGLIETNVTAVGCKSQGQAVRLGNWILLSEKLDEQVSFATGLEGAKSKPGDVIQVMDRSRAGKRVGGRLLSATASQVVLDKDVDLVVGQTYTFYAAFPDGTVGQTTVSTAAANGINTLTLSPPLAQVPTRAAIWMLSCPNLVPQLFRVLSVQEQRGDPKDGSNTLTYQYVCLQYDPDKYAAIEDGATLVPPSISTLTAVPPTPQNPTATEALCLIGATRTSQLTVGCDSVAGAKGYELTYRLNSDAPKTVQLASSTWSLFPAPLGTYTIDIRAVSAAGVRSAPASLVTVVDGISDPPPDLTGLTSTFIGTSQVQFTWNAATDPGVTCGGTIQIRYSSATSGATWASASPVVTEAGSSTQALVALSTGTYLFKPVTFDGVESANGVYLVFGASSSGGALSATASPTGLYASGTSTPISTSGVTVSVSGGTPPYTHAWAYVSGDTTITCGSPASNITEFGASPGADSSVSGVWQDTITDSATPTPATSTVQVNITISNTTGSTGGGYGGSCVACDSWLPDGRVAGVLGVGDEIEVADEVTLRSSIGDVQVARRVLQPCCRVTTISGISLVCSLDAPLPVERGLGTVQAVCALGERIAVREGAQAPRFEEVSSVKPVGVRWVQFLTVGNRSFWAGEQPDRFILHHNLKEIP